jgi:hypothetical protein
MLDLNKYPKKYVVIIMIVIILFYMGSKRLSEDSDRTLPGDGFGRFQLQQQEACPPAEPLVLQSQRRRYP